MFYPAPRCMPFGPQPYPFYPRRVQTLPPPTVRRPLGHDTRRLNEPMTKYDGLALLSHCFGFRDASYLGIPQDVVFVAHDFEAYTPAHSEKRPVTEAGVAFFDTRTIKRVGDPGQHGEDWLSQILAAHVRVEDRGHLINRHWANSCGHQFDFGHSQWVPIDDMKTILDRTIRIPDRGVDEPITARDMSGHPALVPEQLRNRNIVLVSHAFHNDDGYMRAPDIGFDYNAYGTVVGIVDTQVMGSRAGFEGMRYPALKRLCGNFDIDLLHPHNAGNDAVYTMIALILLGIEHAHLRGYRPGRGPVSAASIVEQMMARNEEDGIRYWLKNPPKAGYRCEICGRRNSHAAEECELHIRCEACGCHGHREDRCKEEWMENAKLGYGNPKSFATPADKIRHEFAAKVRAVALAAKAPVPLAANGHSQEVIDKAFPLLPTPGKEIAIAADDSTESASVSSHASSVKPVVNLPRSPPRGPAKQRSRPYAHNQQRMNYHRMQYPQGNYSNSPPVLAAGQSVVTSDMADGGRFGGPLMSIDGNATYRRGKKNWTKLELNMVN